MNKAKTSNLTIVMYHYVHDTRKTSFPKIHALEVGRFRKQVEQLQSSHTLVSPQQVINYLLGREDLPANSCLLSFDDGLKDHYTNIFPILSHYSIYGWFFPITSALDGIVADANKLQFILAKLDVKIIVNEFHDFINMQTLNKNSDFFIDDKIKKDPRYRFDDVLTANLKITLQIMPNDLRAIFLRDLFIKFIGNEKEFAHELYLSRDEIKEMSDAGHFFGSHTHTHQRLDQLSREEQEKELMRSKEALQNILGKPPAAISYPYGRYNKITLELLPKLGYTIGLGTDIGINEGLFDKYALKRINANDL